jgi:hypothetical protein
MRHSRRTAPILRGAPTLAGGLAALLLAAAPALGQPEPSAADAGKGAPAPRPEEPAPPPPAPDPSAAAEAEHGPPTPPAAERAPPSPAPQPGDRASPEDKGKAGRRAPQKPAPQKAKVTGGQVAEAGGGVAGSLLLKGVGTAVGGPVDGFAAGWVGGKLGGGAVHVVRKLFHKDKAPEPAPVQEAQAAPPTGFEPGPLLDVPAASAPGEPD